MPEARGMSMFGVRAITCKLDADAIIQRQPMLIGNVGCERLG